MKKLLLISSVYLILYSCRSVDQAEGIKSDDNFNKQAQLNYDYLRSLNQKANEKISSEKKVRLASNANMNNILLPTIGSRIDEFDTCDSGKKYCLTAFVSEPKLYTRQIFFAIKVKGKVRIFKDVIIQANAVMSSNDPLVDYIDLTDIEHLTEVTIEPVMVVDMDVNKIDNLSDYFLNTAYYPMVFNCITFGGHPPMEYCANYGGDKNKNGICDKWDDLKPKDDVPGGPSEENGDPN